MKQERIFNISIAGCGKVAHLHARAIENDTEPLVTGEDGRKTVELFSAIYRSTRDNKPVKFPLRPEPGFDGRADLP